MRTVMVTKFVPLPADSGGKQRSLALLTRLAARGRVVLCAFDDGSADRGALAKLGVELRTVPWPQAKALSASGIARTRSVSAGRFWSRRLADQVRDACADAPDLLQVEYAQLAPYANGLTGRLRVLDLHNVESALVTSIAHLRRPPVDGLLRLEASRLRAIERAAVSSFDAVAVVSERERDRLGAAPGRVLICPNGWEPAPALPFGDEQTVVFVALLGWAPNVDAACWLAREAWPSVRRRVPQAKLLLVGRDPAPDVLALRSDDVEVTGSVPDVRPYLARARVATAPLRAGGGARLKILEALGAGRPVVATTLGAEGLETLAGSGLLLADSAQATADVLVGLLEDPARARTLGAAGHAAVSERYAWDVTLRPLLDLVDAAV